MRISGRSGASLSSRIPNYPGTDVQPDEIAPQKYLFTHYETVLRYSWTSGVAISRFLAGLKEGELWGGRCRKCERAVIPPRM
jgi:hypothetical protein